MGSHWSNTISKIEAYFFAKLVTIVTGIPISRGAVEAGAYSRECASKNLVINMETVSDDVISLAEDLYKESRDRYSAVASKVGTLLTVTGIGASATLTSLSIMGIPSTTEFYISYFIVAGVFICTGWFWFRFLGVGRVSMPNIDQTFLDLVGPPQKAAYLRDLLVAAELNGFRNDFIVDVYKAARRISAAAFFCALVLISIAVFDRIHREDRFVMKLRSDPKLVELLRGPKGERGPPGSPTTANEIAPLSSPPVIHVPVIDNSLRRE